MIRNLFRLLPFVLVAAALVAGGYVAFLREGAGAVVGESGAEAHGAEDQVLMPDERLMEAGVELAVAGPGEIVETRALNGAVQADPSQVVEIAPRFPGVLRALRKTVGDRVARGEIVALVDSNQSLTAYEVKAPQNGVVTARRAAPGDFISEARAILSVADLSRVWVDFQVFSADLKNLREGAAVAIEPGDGGAPVEARIDYIAPVGDPATQSVVARAVVDNAQGRLRPGLFAAGRLTVARAPAKIAARTDALQTLEGRPVVFVRKGDVFVASPVRIGRRDARFVEILEGVAAGDVYAAANSYVVKAEIAKGAASHDH